MSAWGKTGRVTLAPACRDVDFVDVDGKYAGSVLTFMRGGYMVSLGRGWIRDIRYPSLDAAVMWVLRRVDPGLWREERGAWLVRKRPGGEEVERSWAFGRRLDASALHPWTIVDPSGVTRNAAISLPYAMHLARRYAEQVSR